TVRGRKLVLEQPGRLLAPRLPGRGDAPVGLGDRHAAAQRLLVHARHVRPLLPDQEVGGPAGAVPHPGRLDRARSPDSLAHSAQRTSYPRRLPEIGPSSDCPRPEPDHRLAAMMTKLFAHPALARLGRPAAVVALALTALGPGSGSIPTTAADTHQPYVVALG